MLPSRDTFGCLALRFDAQSATDQTARGFRVLAQDSTAAARGSRGASSRSARTSRRSVWLRSRCRLLQTCRTLPLRPARRFNLHTPAPSLARDYRKRVSGPNLQTRRSG